MYIARFALAAALLTAPVLYAQENDAKPQSSPQPENTQSHKSDAKQSEAFRITLTFKSTDSAKVTTQRSYTLIATTNEMHSQIRDQSDVPFPVAPGSSQYTYQTIETDVDNLGGPTRIGDSVFIGLRISTASLAQTDTDKLGPIRHHHTYTLAPTVPIGKQTTVYSATDSVNNTTVEVQILIQPATIK